MWIAIVVLAVIVLVEGIFLFQAWRYCWKLHKYLDSNDPTAAIIKMQVKFDALTTVVNTLVPLPQQIRGGGVPPVPDPDFP